MVTLAAFLFLVQRTPGQWVLKTGVKVSFVMVLPSEKKAWRPDGTTIDYGSMPVPGSPVWSGKETSPLLVALLNTPSPFHDEPDVVFKLPATDLLTPRFTLLCPGTRGRIWMSGYNTPEGQPSEQDVAVGVADGPWKVVGTAFYRKSESGVHATRIEGVKFRAVVKFGPESVVIAVPAHKKDAAFAWRCAVLDGNGREMTPICSSTDPKTGATRYWFTGGVQSWGKTTLDRDLTVSRVELESRRFQWHTMPVTHFKPN